MMIPLSTDAPVYHYPVVTIVLMVVNVFAFLFTGFGADHAALMDWGLVHGEGLHPVQWVTNNFIHGGIFHLVGNMIFLWGFGLVVEGKLGWWRYLLVYMAIGVAQGAFLQTCMLGYDAEKAQVERLQDFGWDIESEKELLTEELREEGFTDEEIDERLENFDSEFLADMGIPAGSVSFGASTVIFGLLAISLVWAPKNEVTVLWLIGYRAVTFDMTIMWFAALFIGEDLLVATFLGFSMSTSTLHATGAVLGGIVGVVLFKMKMVDCEDWDIFAVMSGHYGPWARDKYGYRIDREAEKDSFKLDEPEEKTKKKKKGPSKTRRSKKLEDITLFVDDEDYLTASDALYNLRRNDPEALPDENTLKRMAVGLAKEQLYSDAVPLMQDYIECYPESASGMQLRLAGVHLKQKDQKSARRVLKRIDRETLSDSQKATFKKMAHAVQN